MFSKMFTSLKNKIKEETGNEVPRLFHPKLRSPNHESNSSLGSTVSSDDGNSLSSKIDYSWREKELREKLETLGQHAGQLEEKDREWQEKFTSLQNNMHAAQAVWSGEAAAARREAREVARRSGQLSEQLQAALANASRLQNKLDQFTEEIEAERRGWAQERQRLAAAAEDALHRLSLAAPLHSEPQDENNPDKASSNEVALKRKLEEAQLHLHDIKTSWSGQIAALETQVGRLSRQAGEEGAERRRVEKERDALLERLREKETQLEQAQATLEDKEAKMALLAAEAGEASRCGRAARAEAQLQRLAADTLTNKLSENESRLAQCQEQNNVIMTENSELKDSINQEKQNVMELRMKLELLNAEQEKWTQRERSHQEEVRQLLSKVEETERMVQSEQLRLNEIAKDNEALKYQMDSIKHELNEIHERYDRERRDKEESLMRNAQMSQTLEIYRQEMRQQEAELVDFKAKVKYLENTLAQHSQDQHSLQKLHDAELKYQAEIEKLKSDNESLSLSEKQLQECIKDLNIQLAEKTKNVRILQNRLSDMKKTLQRELRGGSIGGVGAGVGGGGGTLDPLGSSVVEGSSEDADITHKYLKHVLIKFLTSREVEARHLTRAVAALLGLTAQEEALLRDTLAWRSGLAAWLTPPPRHTPT